MISANTNMKAKDGNPNCKCQTKIKEISKLKPDLIEREDGCIFWYRQFEDAKGQSMNSAKHGSVNTVT